MTSHPGLLVTSGRQEFPETKITRHRKRFSVVTLNECETRTTDDQVTYLRSHSSTGALLLGSQVREKSVR